LVKASGCGLKDFNDSGIKMCKNTGQYSEIKCAYHNLETFDKNLRSQNTDISNNKFLNSIVNP